MRYLKFVPAICAAVALGSGAVLGADYTMPTTPPASTSPAQQGIISAINLEKGTVVIVPPGSAAAGTTPTKGFLFFVNAQTKIIKNNQTATLKDLAIGDFCRAQIKYSSDGAPFALSVQASSPQSQPGSGLKFVTGVISAIDYSKLAFELTGKSGPDGTAPVLKFFADKETKIIKNGHPVGFGDLKVGNMAGVGFAPSPTLQPGSAVRAAVIEVKNPVTPPPGLKTVTGPISNIDYAALTFTLFFRGNASLQPVSLTVLADKETKIRKNGRLVGFGDLRNGDLVSVGFVSDATLGPGSKIRAVVIEAKMLPTTSTPGVMAPR